MSAFSLYARLKPGYEARLAASVGLLRDAADSHPGRIVQATSLGAEDMVITDLIARHHMPIALATLDTGKLHAQTLELMATVEGHYGLELTRYQPQQEPVRVFIQRHGEKAMLQSPELRKACCQLRKLEPLQRMLAGQTAWVTGIQIERDDVQMLVAGERVAIGVLSGEHRAMDRLPVPGLAGEGAVKQFGLRERAGKQGEHFVMPRVGGEGKQDGFDRFGLAPLARRSHGCRGEAVARTPVEHATTAWWLAPAVQLEKGSVAGEAIEQVRGIWAKCRRTHLEKRGSWLFLSLRQRIRGIDLTAELHE